jgi:WD40 repeat protein
MQLLKTTKDHGKKICCVLLALVISVFLSSISCFGEKNMDPIYNIDEAKSISPEVYNVESSSSLSLFPVPQNNAIGTNDLNNAITILSFHKRKVKYNQYFKNAFSQVGGGGIFLPVFSQDTIGFGQVRRFVFYNFETKKHERYRIAASIEDTIEKIAVADAEKRQFIFEVEAHNPGSDDPWDFTNHLQLMDLSGEEPKLIKEILREKGVTWSVVADKVFLYDYENKKLQVLNLSFEPAQHPLADELKRNKDRIDFSWIRSHPNLPFAILTGGENDEVIISWEENKKILLSLFGNEMTVTQFSFSPDGKWVVFKKENFADDTTKTYLMPVSEKYPNYLGSPILLLENYFNEYNCAWTTNPISFVGSSGHKLYRWELTNEAHPESDKPTFHDYIVEKDLEKLTREKKQGLGGNA